MGKKKGQKKKGQKTPTNAAASRSIPLGPENRVFVRPLAHAKITRARCANACAVVGRRVQRSNASRSSSVSLSTGMGRPIAMRVPLSIARTLGPYMLFHLFQTHETSVFSVKSSLVVSSAYLASTSGDGRQVALPSIAHLHTLHLVAWMIRARCSASRS